MTLLNFLGENAREELKKHYIKPSESRAITLPPKDIIIGADIHGCKKDLEGIFRTYTKHLFAGEDIYLVLLGDYIHGLQAMKTVDGRIVAAGPAYPDESIECILKIIEMRELLGDRFVPLLGDHDFSLIFPSFSVSKYGINQTEEFSRKLTDQQKQVLKDKVSNFPIAARTQNDFILVHASSAPMAKSWEELEKLELTEPKGNYFYWMNETIEGRLLMGRHDKISRGGREVSVRVISYEDNKTFLRNMQAKALVTGHSGSSSFIFKKDGKEIKYNGAPGFIFDKGNQAVLVTTEGPGYERGREGDGSNHYGKEFSIDSMHAPGTILYSNVGEDMFGTHQMDLEDLNYPRALEHLKSAIERKHSQKALPERFVKRYEANMPALEKELSEDNALERLLNEAAEALDRDRSKNTVDAGLPDPMYLSYLDERIHRIFLQDLVTKR